MQIADYIAANFDVVKEVFPEMHIACPWCGDTRGKFQFNIEKTVGRCWRASCDHRATLVDLIVKVEQTSFFLAAKKASELKKASGIASYTPREVTPKDYSSVGSLPAGAIAIRDIEKTYLQLEQNEKQVIEAGIKYLLRKRNADLQQLMDIDAAIAVSGKWYGRVLLPAIEDGVVVSLTGRSIEVEMPNGAWIPFPDVVGEKYKHPSDEDGYNDKRTVIYGIDDAKFFSNLVIVEDPFSVLALTAAGYGTVSFWGTSATEEQRLKLNLKWQVANRCAIILLDSDAASAANKMASQFMRFTPVSIAQIFGLDPDEDIEGAKIAINNAKPFTNSSEIESLILL